MTSAPPQEPVFGPAKKRPDQYIQGDVLGVPVRLISVDMKDPYVLVAVNLAKGFPTAGEKFESIIRRNKPTAAINGSYFSTTTKQPIGDILVDGVIRYQGMMGTVLAITPMNEVFIFRVPRNRTLDWRDDYQTVLGCGPALVLNGKIDLKPQEEGFKDPAIMGSTYRTGVGVTEDQKLLLVHTRAKLSFNEFAKVMLALKCRDAMNLDAGSSRGMYYRGKVIQSPSRPIANVLSIYAD